MPRKGFQTKLKGLKTRFKKAKEREAPEFGECPVEDGVYIFNITECELGESQASGRLQVHWGFTVAEGDNEGQTVHDYDGLETEDNLFWVLRKLGRLGYDVDAMEDPSELEAVFQEVAEEQPLISGRVKTKDADEGTFTHVYINKLLEEGDGGEEEEAEEEEPETEEEEEGVEEPEEEEAEEGESEEEEPEEEDDTEEIELEEGMFVEFQSKGKDVAGEILEFIDDNTKARIQTEEGKVFKVSVEKLNPVEGEEEPEPEPPTRKVSGKKKTSKKTTSRKKTAKKTSRR